MEIGSNSEDYKQTESTIVYIHREPQMIECEEYMLACNLEDYKPRTKEELRAEIKQYNRAVRKYMSLNFKK